MTYRVINLSTGEIAAELADYAMARELAEQLADNDNHTEQWAVIELVTRFETPMKGP